MCVGAVRNVLGSNGSVLRAFEQQVALVVYAGAIGDPGEVLILDMGEPVRILDVAERFAARHDPPLEIVFTGRRPNETLHEDLIATDGHGVRRVHDLVTHVATEPLRPSAEMSTGSVPNVADMHSIGSSGADVPVAV